MAELSSAEERLGADVITTKKRPAMRRSFFSASRGVDTALYE
jgi:hypothetical protein